MTDDPEQRPVDDAAADATPADKAPATTRRWLKPLLGVAAVLALVGLRTYVVEPVRVTSDSMSPTLERGAVVLVQKLERSPERGDLVTFDSPVDGERNVKRVVGVGGDVVDIRDAILHVNDRAVQEPYVDLASIDALYYGPVTVPDDTVLVLGDRRAGSVDSRRFGPLRLDALTGVVLVRLWG